jgi:DNA-binding transcriptional ArsR family regulator
VKFRNPEVFRYQAEFCKMLAHPIRLMIMTAVSQGELSVGEIARTVDAPLATVSQHLGALKSKHMVECRKEGKTVLYRSTDPRLLKACILIRTILLEGMRKRGEVAEAVDPKGFEVDKP